MDAENLETCYICLHKVTSLTGLLDEDSDKITFMTKLSRFCTIEVIPESVGLCSDCLSQLRVSYKFLHTVTTSQEAWKGYFAQISPKTEEIVIVNDAEYVTSEIAENSSEIEEAENVAQNSSCFDPLNHDDHYDSDLNPRKGNDNNFKCANCLKIFLDEEFSFHGCFKDMQKNVDKSNDNNRNMEPQEEHVIDCHELKAVENTEPNPQCRNNVDYNNFMCARCSKVFSYEEFLFHECFKGTHSKVNKSNSNELKKAKNSEANSQCGNNYVDCNFECAKCLKVFSDEEFLFHSCFKSTQKIADKFNNHGINTKSKIDNTSKKKLSHSCTVCRKLFASKLKLQKHMRDFHEFKEVENIELDSGCRNDLDTDSNNLESDLNIFKCVKCLKVFTGEEFILHGCFTSSRINNNSNNNACEETKVERKPQKEVTYECMTCKKSFEAKFLLHLHSLRAHKGKQYRCNICERDFKKSLHLKQHLTLHTGVKYFSCEICQKEFRLMCAKQRHMKVHTAPLGERTKKTPFLCNICGRHFPFSNGYQRHMNIHLGIKRHECKVCNRRFRESTHLKVHMRTHTGEKPYICDVCGQAFSLRASLRKHISNIHNNRSQSPNFNFMCRFCGENFSRNVELHTHIGRVHSDENI